MFWQQQLVLAWAEEVQLVAAAVALLLVPQVVPSEAVRAAAVFVFVLVTIDSD